jgi:hypothetical protein
MVTFKVFVEQAAIPGLGHTNFFQHSIMDPSQMKGSRHRRSVILDVPINRKKSITVPKYKQAEPNIIRQIEQLKLSSFNKMPLSIPDIKKIAKKFNINSIPTNKTTKLKNLGLGITFNKDSNQFFLHKI